jgi:hypothetical protein
MTLAKPEFTPTPTASKLESDFMVTGLQFLYGRNDCFGTSKSTSLFIMLTVKSKDAKVLALNT